MNSDEQAIRNLFEAWQKATTDSDAQTLRRLMADDVIFLTVGNAPIRGREAFMALADSAPKPFRLDFQSDVNEIKILGDWAYAWTDLAVAVTPAEGAAPIRRSGDILTILRKESNGEWVIARDANMLTLDRPS